jgi:phosphosulfolactate synthase (CoM biosynthesis protein A)
MENLDVLGKNNESESLKKSRRWGWLALTKEDHERINSTPNQVLIDNPGKAQHELMSEEEIAEYLNDCLKVMSDMDSINNGFADLKADEFDKAIYFLKSINKLPEQFERYL